jgi:DNA primase
VIPPGFLQELLSRTDIVEVVGRHVELKRSGSNHMGLCPFHAEKSPSFSVNAAKQFYHCFGCGASGDAIRFLSEHLGMSFVDAVEDLASRVAMAVPREQVSAEDRQQRKRLAERRLSITEALTKAAAFYRGELKNSREAVAYLKRRGLSGDIAARFGLGWASDDWRGLQAAFPDYADPVLEDAGLVRVQTTHAEPGAVPDAGDAEPGAEAPAPPEKRRYDWFRARVMFPIRAVGGEVIGFGGRVLDDSKPKYMNSPETAVFTKGRELYGLHEARQAIRERGHVLVVEGYMDVVALAQTGFGQAVATLGTACTGDHVQKLFRFSDHIIFSFDGDAAGRRAAGRALEACLPHATDLRRASFVFLPAEHDPDSFVRERGQRAFEELLASAVPLSRQFIERAAEGADRQTPEGRARLMAQARPLWEQLPPGAFKRQLLAEVAREGLISTEELASAWRVGVGTGAGARGASSSRPVGDSRGGLRWPRQERQAAGPWLSLAPRRAPASPADLALRLLLRHSAWWDGLTHEDHQRLHALGGAHAACVAWLEQQLLEHGPLPWSALEDLLRGHELHAQAQHWVSAGALEDEHQPSDLQRVLAQIHLQALQERAAEAAAQGNKQALEQLNRDIASVRRALAA